MNYANNDMPTGKRLSITDPAAGGGVSPVGQQQAMQTPQNAGGYMRVHQAGDANSISYPPLFDKPKADINAPWYSPEYARAANASDKTGLQLEQDRRAVNPGSITDPVRSIVAAGAMPDGASQNQAQSSYGNEGRSVPKPITSQNPGAVSAGQGIAAPSQPGGTYAPPDFSSMTREQRGQAADGYRAALDKLTGMRSGGDQGYEGMAKRFSTYEKNPDAMALVNMREDALGSGIRFEKSPGGGLSITNNGKYDPIPAAGGSTINMQEGNNAMARANDIRGQMINSMIAANGGNGIGIIGDGGVEAANAEKTQRWAMEDMARNIDKAGSRSSRAAMGQAMNQMLAGQNQQALEAMRQQGILAGQAVQMRGQDISSQNDAARNALAQQQLAIDSPLKAAQTEHSRVQTGSAKLIADLQNRAASGDAKAVETLRALNGKSTQATDRFMAVQGGEELSPDGTAKVKRPSGVFDAQTGRFISMDPQQAGAPKKVGDSPHPEGTMITNKNDGKTYIVKNGVPVLAQ